MRGKRWLGWGLFGLIVLLAIFWIEPDRWHGCRAHHSKFICALNVFGH